MSSPGSPSGRLHSFQRLGLEWAYRLYQEPKRLWSRYAATNAQFSVLLVRGMFDMLRKRTRR